jgi:hypothetical protein
MAWTLRGSTVIPCWEMMNMSKRPDCDTENALERIQWNIILVTSLKDNLQVFQMLRSLLGMSSEVIQVSEDDVCEIMENICHGCWNVVHNIFYPKRHDM